MIWNPEKNVLNDKLSIERFLLFLVFRTTAQRVTPPREFSLRDTFSFSFSPSAIHQFPWIWDQHFENESFWKSILWVAQA